MRYEDVIKTRIQGPRTRETCETKRRKLIQEAIGWKRGTLDEPIKYLITKLPNGIEVYFLKPGKEISRAKRPNPHDMTPVIEPPDRRLTFNEIWSYLSKISVIDFDSFKAVLTLIYRNAYLIDHVEAKEGILRYQPGKEIVKCIDYMDDQVGEAIPYGLKGLLHFLDVLGWNEDVKYHTENNRPTFDGRYDFNVGRINTLLTCIRVPYQASIFVKHVIDKTGSKKDIDFALLFTIMQQFAQSRGTCTPTQQQLITWLSPYVVGGLEGTSTPSQKDLLELFSPRLRE